MKSDQSGNVFLCVFSTIKGFARDLKKCNMFPCSSSKTNCGDYKTIFGNVFFVEDSCLDMLPKTLKNTLVQE